MTFRRLRRPLAAALLAALALTTVAPGPALAGTRVPAVPVGLPTALEPLAGYLPASSCDPTAKPGTAALGKLLTTTYPGTSYGISRTCGVDPLPTSEHYDGRAVDWMNSARKKKQAVQAQAVVGWLTAPDATGQTFANARRLGVMYVIWDGRIWGAYAAERGWRPYSSCADHPGKSWDSTCHRDHMHLSLSWPGALGTTSFWTGRVATADYGPCRPVDLNWAAPYAEANPDPCPRYPTVQAPAGASANLRTLTTYSGMRVHPGSTGPVVTAVQKALRVSPASGTFGPVTRKAVKTFQTSHGLRATGNVNTRTWRALLKAQAPAGS